MFQRYSVLCACLLSLAVNAHADDLVQIYQRALQQDTTYQRARATWLVAKEQHALSYLGNGSAGSGLAPNISFGGTLKREYSTITDSMPTVNGSNYYNSVDYSLQLTQPIFHVDTWSKIAGAGYDLRAATATYLYAGQQLMMRTAQAYFKVLRQLDALQYAMANRIVLQSALDTANVAYKKGLVAKTDVLNARASYELAKAGVIEQRIHLKDDREALAAIINQRPTRLKGLPLHLPVISPAPKVASAWVKRAAKQNYMLKAERMRVLSARNSIRTKKTAFLPTVDATAGYTYETSNQSLGTGSKMKHAAVGLSVSLPIFEGGFRFADTQKARYEYLAASDQQRTAFRQLTQITRNHYFHVLNAKSLIEAAHESVRAAQAQLLATQVAYRAGSKTMVDLLSAISNVFDAITQWSQYRYDYIDDFLALKLNVGTLSPADLQQVNTWLGQPVDCVSPDLTRWAEHLGVPQALIREYLSAYEPASHTQPTHVALRKRRMSEQHSARQRQPHSKPSIPVYHQPKVVALPQPVVSAGRADIDLPLPPA